MPILPFCSLSSGITNVVKKMAAWWSPLWAINGCTSMYPYSKLKAIGFYMFWLLYSWFFRILDHKFEHTINVFWNRHIIHQQWRIQSCMRFKRKRSFFILPFCLFLLPVAILGVPPWIIQVIAPLHLFAQFGIIHDWLTNGYFGTYHCHTFSSQGTPWSTTFIWIKHVSVRYLSFGINGLASILQELDEVKPVYGVKRPVPTWKDLDHFSHICK